MHSFRASLRKRWKAIHHRRANMGLCGFWGLDGFRMNETRDENTISTRELPLVVQYRYACPSLNGPDVHLN